MYSLMPGSLSLFAWRHGDADDLDALVLVVVGEVDHAIFICLDDRAMIGQEDHDDDVFFDVGQAEAGVFAIGDGGEAREVRRLVADTDDLVVLAGESRRRRRAKEPRGSKQFSASMRSPVGITKLRGSCNNAAPIHSINRNFAGNHTDSTKHSAGLAVSTSLMPDIA